MPNASPKPTIKDLLTLAIQVVHRSRDIYLELERRFSHHPRSASLWNTMAGDEEAQVHVLVEVLRSASPEKLAAQVPDDTWVNTKEIWNLVHTDLLAMVKNLKDAHSMVYQLEYFETNLAFEFLSVDVVPGEVEREFIHTHIAMHQQRLANFGKNIIGENWLEIVPL